MTWLEFWSGAAANTIGSIVGVVIGVPIALAMERARHRREEAIAREQTALEAKRTAERLRQQRAAVVSLLSRNLESNLHAIERAEIEVGYDRPVYRSDLELQTWDALKPVLVGIIDDPEFVTRLATFFARLHEFASLLARRMTWQPGFQGFTDSKAEVVKMGPELRHHGRLILEELRKVA